MRNLIVILLLTLSSTFAAVTGESVVVGAGSDRELPARYFRPNGAGPFPAVVVLHGSGGLWANDNPAAGAMVRHFEDWAQTFASEGFASLFVDSFTPRGLVEFRSRRPAEDPAIDDALCSPAYERPKDAYKALAFLQARPEIIDDRVALMGFSHGAETALASVVSTTLDRNWTMSYLKLDGSTETRLFPAPVRWEGASRFAVAIAYYPGCGFYGYFGSPSSTAANLYMPYAPTLILHGSADPLYADNNYPDKLVLKANSHAVLLQLGHNMAQLNVYPNATHSFDEAPPVVGDQPETPNQTAKRLAQEKTLKWLRAHLKATHVSATRVPETGALLSWIAPLGARQTLRSGDDPSNINAAEWTDRIAGSVEQSALVPTTAQRRYFQLQTTHPAVP